VLHDITEIRRLERARRDFVANVSHEFRTPLTAIRGFAETLLEGGLEDLENRRRFIEIIHNHAIRLERLTEDLLRLSQVEAGKLQIELMPASTLSIIEPCIETTRIKAKQKDLVLEADCAPNLPPILGDATLLQGVLQELMDNAVRYTPAGGKIRVTAESAESNVVISVADTGIGIPKSDQDRIFERFYRTDPARSRESGGTGLGLSIAKHIVEAHGGKITVDSQVGAGSTFRLILPSTK
jgi:two-component system phosphate regulon sensor histidine kinase PhoR